MIPAFSGTSVRFATSLFLEIVQKAKTHWVEQMDLEGKDEITLNVEPWLDAISFDCLGEAGFSHSFNAVDGPKPRLAQLFSDFVNPDSWFTVLRGLYFASLSDAPLVRWLRVDRMILGGTRRAITGFVRQLLQDERERGEREAGKRSMMAAILKAENGQLSEEEIVAQLNTLILAAYETTATLLTWCFHELSMHPNIQAKLREELWHLPSLEPAQLEGKLPYLDAVTKECIRLHPTIPIIRRVVKAADRVPLSSPICLNGQYTQSVYLPAGAELVIPVESLHRSPSIWGPDAEEFKPERWLDGSLPKAAGAVRGCNGLLTFLDGPRSCLGRGFAVAEIKAVLAIFFRDFLIQPWTDGEDVSPVLSVFARARNGGVRGLMLRVRRVDAD